MMNGLTHVAITRGYLLLYLLLYYKADFADTDILRIQMVPLFMNPPTSSIIVDIRDGEYVAANSLPYASLALLADYWWNPNNRRLPQRFSTGHAPRCDIDREAIG